MNKNRGVQKFLSKQFLEIKKYSLKKNKENLGLLFIIFLINCIIIPIFSFNYIRKLENGETVN